MAAHGKVASRYAKALLAFAKGPKEARKLAEELDSFAKTVKSHKELEMVLTSALFAVEKRRGVVEDVAKKLGISADAVKALLTVNEAGRLKDLSAIADRLHILLLESANVVPLQVYAASDVTADERKKIETKFAKLLGKEVEASYAIEPALIGGLKVVAGGRTYDGSVSGWLENFEEQLVGGNI